MFLDSVLCWQLFFNFSILFFNPQFSNVFKTSSIVFFGFLSLFTILLKDLQASLGLISIKFEISSSGFYISISYFDSSFLGKSFMLNVTIKSALHLIAQATTCLSSLSLSLILGIRSSKFSTLASGKA